MSQTAEKFWDKQAKQYDRAEKQFSSVYQEILSKTTPYLSSDDIVLDYGCATGTKTMELAKKVKHIHGLDFSSEMIREAVQKSDRSGMPNISFSQGIIFNTDIGIASYDKVIAYGIIQLLEDPETVIMRVHELLKPGGLFISTTALMKEKMTMNKRLEVISYRLLKRARIFPLQINMFTFADVEQLLTCSNFQIIEKEKLFHQMTAGFFVAKKLISDS